MRKKICSVCGEPLDEDQKSFCGLCEDESIQIEGVKHATIRKEYAKSRRQRNKESIERPRERALYTPAFKK